MAINTNTTTSIQKASTVLAKACEETQKNMSKTVKKIYGDAAPKTIKVDVPFLPGVKDDVLFVGLNGHKFYFKRGEKAEMPQDVYQILKDTRQL